MTSSSITVLVAGAGPVGLSAALALSQAGVDVRVVDAAENVDHRMRASTFHPPTLDMIASLGLADDLVAIGLPVPRWQMRQYETGKFVEFDLAAIADKTAYPFRLQVEQHRYCSMAIESLQKSGVAIEFGNGVRSLRQDDDSVTVTLDNGNLQCDWLIGADGANSSVRKSLGLEYGGMTHTHSSVLVLTSFPFHEHLEQISDVSYCWSYRGPFSLLRLKGLWRASLYPGVADLDVAAEEDRVRDWLGYISPGARSADLLDVSPYRVHERCVDRFRVGNVLLAGDAAHLNPPSGGMGMNGGIHDAMNLAGKLLAVIDGEDDALLDLYDRQRQQTASKRVIPQASANRERMSVTDAHAQNRRLARYRAIAADEEHCRRFLLDSSMISILDEANAIE